MRRWRVNKNKPSQPDNIGCFHVVPECHAPVEPLQGGELRPGYVLDGRFLLGEPLSRSGMALIYKAQDIADHNRIVAVKIPHLSRESDPNFFQRFQREEEIGAQLDHPSILKFLVLPDKSRPYIVMEYLSGCTLAHLLDAMRPLSEKDALRIAALVCGGLEHMHGKGIVHRDLKPSNIMVCPDRTIRLIDFGIASAKSARKITLSGLTPAMGTPDYMAPEQVSGKTTDERTDIYSLGVILYEMLTGAIPFRHENPWLAMTNRVTGDPPAPRAENSKLSAEAEEIVLHAMQRNQRDRYQTAAAFRAELETPANVSVTGYSRRLQKPHWRLGFRETPVVSGILLAVGFILLQIIIFFLLHGHFGRR